MSSDLFKRAREKSIVDYLESIGLKPSNKGRYVFFSSPFTADSTPSFCVYPSNTFVDYSSGNKGDIIDLVSQLDKVTKREAAERIVGTRISRARIEKDKPKKAFSIGKYLTTSEMEVDKINRYAKSRGITYGFVHSYFFEENNGSFIKRLAMGFVHRDYNLDICGIKMRSIDSDFKQRFRAKGSLRYYVLENIISLTPILIIVESESSANSLHKVLQKLGISFVIISFGGVANVQRKLPERYSSIKDKYLIIDYDGDEESYQKRLNFYRRLGLSEIKLEFDKGEDINSLYCQKNISKFLTPILNKINGRI